jgi:hypothetical protein
MMGTPVLQPFCCVAVYFFNHFSGTIMLSHWLAFFLRRATLYKVFNWIICLGG